MLIKTIINILLGIVIIAVFYKVFYFYLINPLMKAWKRAKIKNKEYEKEATKIKKI